MCKKNPSNCNSKVKCKCCIEVLDKTEEHDKIGLDIQEVDKLQTEKDHIVIVK
jgi:hypothetical protein